MAPCHIGHALSQVALERTNLPLTISNGRVKTGGQFVERIHSLAAGLRVNLGLQCGDRVAIVALNSDLYLEWLLAVPCAGGVIAPLNYRWSSHEACEAMQQIDPVLLVVDQPCTALGVELKRKFPSLQLVTLGHPIEGAWDAEHILLHSQKELPLFWAPDEVALICFTSGTTGKPKGAAITHDAITVQSLAKISIVKYASADVYLHTSPLCHIGGISSAHAVLLAGGCHVLLPKFRALDALEAIREHKVTSMIAVPAMLKDLTSLLLSRHGKDSDVSSIKMILNGAGRLSLDLLARTVKLFPTAQILSAYGMTEACSSMSFKTLHDPSLCESNYKHVHNELNASSLGGVCVGKPAPHVDLIVSTNSGSKGARGCLLEEGDILVRGPHMMRKYWGKVEQPFDNDGWFSTGDVGWMDHLGQLWLLGRRKDVVKSGGENVHCYEVEEILARHPAVEGVAVAGVHDVRLGEMVGAMVLLKHDWKWAEESYKSRLVGTTCSSDSTATGAQDLMEERVVSAASLRSFCRQQGLSRYKIPKVWQSRSGAFPTTSTGKVKKGEVAKELAAHVGASSIWQDREAALSKL